MAVFFSSHAKSQLSERQIPKKLVEKILLKPGQVVEGQNGRKIAQKIVREANYKFLYRVIYIEKENDFMVISAYKTTNLKKYWVEV